MNPADDGRLDGLGRFPFRLRIGVCGHRDPAELESLTRDVRASLERIRRRFGSTRTTSTSYVVLSELAAGADRLVAREALDVLAPHVELHAVLRPGLDEAGVEVEGSDEFGELLAAASLVTVVDAARGDGAFERTGRFIVDHSDLLIALWDGLPARGRGGTAEIVQYAKRDQRVATTVLPTSRRGEPAAGQRFRLGRIRRRQDLKPITLTVRDVRRLNRRSGESRRFQRALSETCEAFAPPSGCPTPPGYDAVAAWALPHFVRADSLARRSQWWYKRLSESLYLLAVLAVTTVALQSQFGWPNELAFIEAGFMIGAFAIYAAVTLLQLRRRWHDYRSLAEAFRSGFFVTIAGARNRTAMDASGPLASVRKLWYERAFADAWTKRPPAGLNPGEPTQARRYLLETWVKNEYSYHRRVSKRFSRMAQLFTGLVFGLFGLTVFVAFLHALTINIGPVDSRVEVTLALVLPTVAAALTGIRDLNRYRIHEHRARNTADGLGVIKERAESLPVGVFVEQIHDQIRTEAHEWSSVISFQDLEFTM